MGNIAYVSFNRAVSDEEFQAMLEVTADNVFKGALTCGPHAIGVKEEILTPDWAWTLQFYRYSAGKFGSKHMRGFEVGWWVSYVIWAFFCDTYGAKLTDEGVEGSWQNDLYKYTSFDNYFRRGNKHWLTTEADIQKYMPECPEILKIP